MDVSETGWQLADMCLSPFLKTGTIHASLQSDGTCPVYNPCKYWVSWSEAVLRINAGKESGPVALNGFIPLSSL